MVSMRTAKVVVDREHQAIVSTWAIRGLQLLLPITFNVTSGEGQAETQGQSRGIRPGPRAWASACPLPAGPHDLPLDHLSKAQMLLGRLHTLPTTARALPGARAQVSWGAHEHLLPGRWPLALLETHAGPSASFCSSH